MNALLTLGWVPGTHDTVRVRGRHEQLLVKVQDVQAVLGRPALDGLYLRGAFVVEDHEDEVAAVWFALSCLAEEDGFAPLPIPARPEPLRGPAAAHLPAAGD